MSDRFAREIDLPDVSSAVSVPKPPANAISVYGRNSKLAYQTSAGVEVLLPTTLKTTEVTFSSPSYAGYFTVTDADVKPTSAINIMQVSGVATGKDADEVEFDTLSAVAIPDNGKFGVSVEASPGPVFGAFKLAYEVI